MLQNGNSLAYEKNFTYLGKGSRSKGGLDRFTEIVEIPHENGDVIVLMDENNSFIGRSIFPPRESADYFDVLTKFEDWVMAQAEKVDQDVSYTFHSWTKYPDVLPLKERLARFDAEHAKPED